MTDFEGLLKSLADGGVNFILIDGVAATVHGGARLTEDVDVVYQRSEENIKRLAKAVIRLNPYLRGAPAGLPFQWDKETIERGLNFTLSTNLGSLDLLGKIIDGGCYDDLLPHTFELELFSIRCRCLNLQQLIHVKRAAGRPKDLEAIAELEALQDETDSLHDRERTRNYD